MKSDICPAFHKSWMETSKGGNPHNIYMINVLDVFSMVVSVTTQCCPPWKDLCEIYEERTCTKRYQIEENSSKYTDKANKLHYTSAVLQYFIW